MTVTPIRQLLEAEPFAAFTLHLGFEQSLRVADPKLCKLDGEDEILYVTFPAFELPERLATKLGAEVFGQGSVEIVDLRHVSRVSVEK